KRKGVRFELNLVKRETTTPKCLSHTGSPAKKQPKKRVKKKKEKKKKKTGLKGTIEKERKLKNKKKIKHL
ncbi:hypothetical protein ACXWN3_09925, partial [Streptococcus pyogenes]